MSKPLRLVVIGDSTAFTDDTGPQLPDHKTLYPNVLAAELERALQRPVRLTVLARAGMDVREAWKTAFKDRHAQFEVLMGAHAVVVGVGSIDHAPAGLPAIAEAIVPYLRPDSLRRRVRLGLRRAHGPLVRLTRARFSHTGAREFGRLYDALLHQVRSLTQGAAGVALGPTSHVSAYYGDAHPMHAARERIQEEIAQRHGFPFIPSWPMVEPATARLNADGIHWPPDVHQAVGEALARALLPQLRDEVPKPSMPSFE